MRAHRMQIILAAAAFAGCGAPEAEDSGEEWVDSTKQEIACSPAPRLVAIDTANGTLIRFRHDEANGPGEPALDGAIAGRVWSAQDRVVSDLQGRFYVIDAAGEVWLVKTTHEGAADGEAVQIADGWAGYHTVIAAGDGVLYTLDDAGALRWFRHSDPAEGEVAWSEESGRVVREGLVGQRITGGGDGVFYGLDDAGALRWYLHLDPDEGEAEWAEGSGAVIASGLLLADLTSSGDGRLYGVTSDGELRVYQHGDPSGGAAGLSADSGRVIARGLPTVGLAAYTPSCDDIGLRAALVRWGMFPAASDAYRTLGLSASRITQTIGNAAASAGYHARDGYANGQPYTAATDISTRGLSRTFIRRLLERMGRVGFAAFYRWPGHDGWPSSEVPHIHANYAGCKMKSQLRGQVTDWLNGRNGLSGHGRYTFFTPSTTAKNKVRNLFNGGPAPSPGGSCVSGGFYCGGDKVSGNSSTLYRCNGGGSTTVVSRCAIGCSVNSGRDDSCRKAGSCVTGGTYCGGDKVNGHPSTLYRCNAGGSKAPTLIKKCPNGCVVPAGRDDYCK
jgi:hypothetical protein